MPSALHSDLDVGFDNAKTIGLSQFYAILFTIFSEKRSFTALKPLKLLLANITELNREN